MKPSLVVIVITIAALAAPAARAEPSLVATASAPRSDSWSLDLRLPVSVTMSDTGPVLGLGGVELGLGRRLSSRWYAGATTELDLAVAGAGTDRVLRAGGEARYIVHEGRGAFGTDSGPWTPAVRYDWIGARGGAEWVGSASGAFAELAVGTDLWRGSMQFGMYLAAGVSVEPTGAYGVAPSTLVARAEMPSVGDATRDRSFYGTVGWRVGVD